MEKNKRLVLFCIVSCCVVLRRSICALSELEDARKNEIDGRTTLVCGLPVLFSFSITASMDVG